ncbi:unnamed protein product [Orchesella dallaii]|uniref:Uncharacterized protein n=1 Tax=Orchesella dallaii TaxID=48710 RepID=A0ABP1QR20_9HEXA
MSKNSGRVYKSKDGERLILYVKGVNLVKPDKWGTCQLVEFLQQIISYDGIYDKNLEWVGIRGIQIVASITVGSSGGLYTLSPRFISRLRVCTMTQPEPDQFFTICNNYLSSLFQNCMSEHPITKRAEAIESIPRGMVTVYKEVRNAFTPVQQSHYQFTPRDLTKWVLGLMRYDVQKNGEEGMKDLYNAWAFECCRIYRDKLVSPEEKTKFDETIVSPVLSQWSMPNVKSLFEGEELILTAIQMSAVEGNKVFLVVEDFQLVDKVFLDMLNSLLSSGEIPGLSSPEELETIIATLRDQASANGYNSSLYAYFAFRNNFFLFI